MKKNKIVVQLFKTIEVVLLESVRLSQQIDRKTGVKINPDLIFTSFVEIIKSDARLQKRLIK